MVLYTFESNTCLVDLVSCSDAALDCFSVWQPKPGMIGLESQIQVNALAAAVEMAHSVASI